MEERASGKRSNIWLKIAGFVVDKRKFIFVLFLIATVYSIFSINKVTVNQDITAYLPDDSDTRRGYDVMNSEFTTPGTAQVMISNITFEEAQSLANKIGKIEGVTSVTFDDSEACYKGSNALLTVTTEGGSEDESSIAAKNEIRDLLEGYDAYIASEIGYSSEMQDMLTEEMTGILIWAVVVVIIVMLISTKAYMLIPVLFLTFGVAVLLNMGTNYWFGEVSFITNAVAVVLQLALSIDYAIILSDRFMEEHEHMDAESAIKVALSKAIPEISSSSLTTVSGMIAMMFMQFKLGYDMGIVLVKAIIFSLIAVFFLMPGILLAFSKQIDRTHHRSLVPEINIIGKFAVKTKKIIPPLFLVVFVLSFFGTYNCPYLYDTNSVEGSKKSESTIAREHIEEVFGATNQLVVIVPKGDYDTQKKVLEQISVVDGVSSALGLANQEIMDGTTLTDEMTPRQFSELTGVDLEVIEALYGFYAYDHDEYGPLVTDIENYGVPMIDMFFFLYDQYEEGYVTLDDDMSEMLTTLYNTLDGARTQLEGEHYVRFILTLDLPIEGEETFDTLDEIKSVAAAYYGDDNVYMVGNSTNAKDLSESFATDNVIISVLTAAFVLLVLLFTFQSWGLPLLLVLTIQGSIWISFSIPTLMHQGVYFIGYLIVSAIQMGATIDYAIVIANRYMQLRDEMEPEKAIRLALNQSFPTVFTSGTIMIAAGFLVGYMTSDVTISVFGIAIGRGATISVLLVLLVLPQILLFGDKFIDKSALHMKPPAFIARRMKRNADRQTAGENAENPEDENGSGKALSGDVEEPAKKAGSGTDEVRKQKRKKRKKDSGKDGEPGKGKKKKQKKSEGGADDEK